MEPNEEEQVDGKNGADNENCAQSSKSKNSRKSKSSKSHTSKSHRSKSLVQDEEREMLELLEAQQELERVKQEEEAKRKQLELQQRIDKLKLLRDVRSNRSSCCSKGSQCSKLSAPSVHSDAKQANIAAWATVHATYAADVSPDKDFPPISDDKCKNVSFANHTEIPTETSGQLNPQSPPFEPSITTTLPQVPSPSALDVVAQSLKEITRHNLLPPSTIPRFSGNILEYQSFKQTFKWKVEGNISDTKERLNQLKNLLDGHPGNLIEGCLHIPSDAGYETAWKLLDQEYGNTFEVERAYLNKLLAWKEIDRRDVVGLKNFGAFLLTVGMALGPNVRALESMHNMISLAQKLPYHLQCRWSRDLKKAERATGAPVPFDAFVKFVRDEAEFAAMTTTVTDRGKKSSFEPSKGKVEPSVKGKSSTMKSFAISSSPREAVKCKCCDKEHSIATCKDFTSKSVHDRWLFLKEGKKNLCFRCLGDYRKANRSKCACNHKCSKCKAPHHVLLCASESSRPKTTVATDGEPKVKGDTGGGARSEASTRTSDTTPAVTDAKPKSKPLSGAISSVCPEDKMLLAIAPARVQHENVSIETYAFLDPGSQSTLCCRSLANRLGVKGEPIDVTLRTVAGDLRCTERITISVGHVDKKKSYKILNVLVTEDIAATVDDMLPPDWITRWPHLADITLPRSLPSSQVEMIIGLNSVISRTILDVRNGEEDEPSGYETLLGWVVHGPTGPNVSDIDSSVNFIRAASVDLNQQLEEQFNRDFPEREIDSRKEMSVEDKRFLQKVSESIQFRDGQYEVGLPFKSDIELPDNKSSAAQRMEGLRRRFERDAEYRQMYTDNMEALVAKGYVERVPDDALERNDGKVCFSTHFGVKHPTKPKKLRVVFDCSFGKRENSLNKNLLQGPDLTNSLLGVFLRFRDGRVAVAGDIEEMFHRVRVPVEDRDVLRFYWWPGGDVDGKIAEYRWTVHPFGATSSPSCVNFALKQTAIDNFHLYDEKIFHAMTRNFYVDNFFQAFDDENTAIETVEKMRSICQKGGWRLNQWIGNNKDVIATIPESERDKSIAPLDLYKEQLPMERTLGVMWCMETDAFTFRVAVKDRPITRRGMLSLVLSVYDPHGFVAPYILQAKILMQEMCARKMAWDDVMCASELARWDTWLADLPQLAKMKIQRSFTPASFGKVVSYRLHHFSDASQVGYGVVSYLCAVNEAGEIHCSFVMGKARVAPLKQMTIPKLELTAAAVAAKMDRLLRGELDMPLLPSTFWTDSTTVLKYLHNESARFHTFVSNRVSLIRNLSDVTCWRYVDTKSNPADLASRGCNMSDFLESQHWIMGPDFLRKSEAEWPQMPEDVRLGNLSGDPEVKQPSPVCAATVEVQNDFLDELTSRTSSWTRLVRVMAYIRRFIHNCRARIATRKGDEESAMKTTFISTDEREEAERKIWMLTQKSAFKREYEALSNSASGSKLLKSSKLVKLSPFLKDGVLRMRGRLSRSDLEYNSKHPIILPSESSVVDMFVRWRHEVLGHTGRDHVMTDIRQHYTILKCGSVIKKVIHKCVQCKRNYPRPLVQEMADLPKDRLVAGEPPFTRVGTDCFGPFIVRKGRTDHKRYGLVFTCLASRAIHIEVLESMESDSFINGLRRFIARRGVVKFIRSDNGTNFVGAEKELRVEVKKLESNKIQEEMAIRRIDWSFNPPYASHFGGVWERMIRTIRRILRGLLQQQRLTDELLVTLMCEVEAIVNSRPLTSVSDNPDDLHPITPAHLLTLSSPEGPPCVTVEQDKYAAKKWRQVQYLADIFWRRWVKEYLPTLQERSKWQTRMRNLKVDDVVVIVDDKLPRCSWPMGRVTKVHTDELGAVREAWVKTQSGEMHRPISKLCMLLENDD